MKLKLFPLLLSSLWYLINILLQLFFHLNWSPISLINLLSKINNNYSHTSFLMQIRINNSLMIFYVGRSTIIFIFTFLIFYSGVGILKKMKFKLFQLSLSYLRYLSNIPSQLFFHQDCSSISLINLLSQINKDCYHRTFLIQIRIPLWF